MQEQGLTVHEAKAAVTEIENAIQSNMAQAIVNNEEMFKIFSLKVFNDNIDIQAHLKNSKGGSTFESIEPVPPNFKLKRIAPEDFNEIKRVTKNADCKFLPPIKLYDIGAFYTDMGPTDNWDNKVEEVMYELNKNAYTDHGHLIQERTIEKSRVKVTRVKDIDYIASKPNSPRSKPPASRSTAKSPVPPLCLGPATKVKNPKSPSGARSPALLMPEAPSKSTSTKKSVKLDSTCTPVPDLQSSGDKSWKSSTGAGGGAGGTSKGVERARGGAGRGVAASGGGYAKPDVLGNQIVEQLNRVSLFSVLSFLLLIFLP